MNEPIQCPKCDATFKKKTGLGSHLLKVHGIAGKSDSTIAYSRAKKAGGEVWGMYKQPNGTYKCPHCPRIFQLSNGLGNHLAMHERQRQGKDAPHHRESKFHCPHCDYSITHQKRLATHIHRHHPGLPAATPIERTTAIVKTNQDVPAQLAPTTNGHYSPPSQDDRDHLIEAAATFAAGRVEELLKNIAFQYDVPPRTFAAVVLRTLTSAKALR